MVAPLTTVVVFDDDHYYMGGLMAEKLRAEGCEVTYVTPAADVSHWTHNTLEQGRVQKRLIELGVQIRPLQTLVGVGAGTVILECVYTERRQEVPCAAVVMVTMRQPNDDLFQDLSRMLETKTGNTPKSVTRIGDCLSPGTIAAAVYSGHRNARELGEPIPDGVPFRRELPRLATD